MSFWLEADRPPGRPALRWSLQPVSLTVAHMLRVTKACNSTSEMCPQLRLPFRGPSPAQRRRSLSFPKVSCYILPCYPPARAPKTPQERGDVCRWWKHGSADGHWAPPLGFSSKTTCCQALKSPPRHTAQGPPKPTLLLWPSISGRFFADIGHHEFHEPDAQTVQGASWKWRVDDRLPVLLWPLQIFIALNTDTPGHCLHSSDSPWLLRTQAACRLSPTCRHPRVCPHILSPFHLPPNLSLSRAFPWCPYLPWWQSVGSRQGQPGHLRGLVLGSRPRSSSRGPLA